MVYRSVLYTYTSSYYFKKKYTSKNTILIDFLVKNLILAQKFSYILVTVAISQILTIKLTRTFFQKQIFRPKNKVFKQKIGILTQNTLRQIHLVYKCISTPTL